MAITLTLGAKTPKEDRVRARTKPEINERIDKELERRIRFYAVQDAQTISERIEELNREWDIERTLEANAASITLAAMFLGATASRKWLLLPIVVSGFLLQHAIQGWCPPVPLLRRLGVRTRPEIEQERYALKALRGDFNQLEREESGVLRHPEQVAQAIRA